MPDMRDGRVLTVTGRKRLTAAIVLPILITALVFVGIKLWHRSEIQEQQTAQTQMQQGEAEPLKSEESRLGFGAKIADFFRNFFGVKLVKFKFWHWLFLVIGVICMLCSFSDGIYHGIIAVLVLGAYMVWILGACSGNFTGDRKLFWMIALAALFLQIVTALLIGDGDVFSRIVWFAFRLIPVTGICALAGYMVSRSPKTAPPVDFAAVYNWVVMVVLFLSQVMGFLGISTPEGRPESDDPISGMTGDEPEPDWNNM